jgi:hypothetical protein
MRRVVVVPSTLALLPDYASLDDPITELRTSVLAAVDWLVDAGPAEVLAATPAAERIGAHLLGARSGSGAGLLVVANGSARRTEKAPGHFDERAAAFDKEIGAALAAGDPSALARIDVALAEELWAPDAPAFVQLASVGEVGEVDEVDVDYDDDPFGVQYWVVRWECGS